jgi:hypothetical protein
VSGHVVDLDLSWLVPCDLGVVDALARLRLHGADGALAELLWFVGLGDVMDLWGVLPWSGAVATALDWSRGVRGGREGRRR